MRFPLAILIAFCATAAAQQVVSGTPHAADPSVPGQQVVIQRRAAPVGSCPVGFAVHRTPQGLILQTKGNSHAHEQGFRVSFAPLGAHAIVSARVTLHGLAGGLLMPAAQATAAPGRFASESRELTPGREGRLFQSVVYTRKLTGLQWVELNELEYADGTQWQEPSPGSCRAEPDHFLLVGAAESASGGSVRHGSVRAASAR